MKNAFYLHIFIKKNREELSLQEIRIAVGYNNDQYQKKKELKEEFFN